MSFPVMSRLLPMYRRERLRPERLRWRKTVEKINSFLTVMKKQDTMNGSFK